jgi:hypothetical protein
MSLPAKPSWKRRTNRKKYCSEVKEYANIRAQAGETGCLPEQESRYIRNFPLDHSSPPPLPFCFSLSLALNSPVRVLALFCLFPSFELLLLTPSWPFRVKHRSAPIQLRFYSVASQRIMSRMVRSPMADRAVSEIQFMLKRKVFLEHGTFLAVAFFLSTLLDSVLMMDGVIHFSSHTESGPSEDRIPQRQLKHQYS